MKRTLLVLCVLCVAWQSPPAPKPHTAKPDLSSPEATVRSFMTAFMQIDLRKAIKCIAGAKISRKTDELEQQFKQEQKQKGIQEIPSFDIVNMHTDISGETAKATLKFEISFLGRILTASDSLKFHREHGEWKLVPENVVHVAPRKHGDDYITATVATIANPDIMRQAWSRARQSSCLSNVKLIALASEMFSQDYNEKFALKATSYKKSLMPYMKIESIFHCPEDKSGAVSYSFNRNLEGVSLRKIAKPAETVMIYEGKNQKLAFRHNGGANVGFVDGHSKLILKEKAKTLRWKP